MRMSGCRIATRVVLMALAACLFAAELANAGNINITATYSASISYYFDPPGSSFICSESESNSGPSAGGALSGITCTPPYDAPVPGMFVNTSYDAYSGGAEITGCDVRGDGPPIFLETSCTAGVYLEGEYYFAFLLSPSRAHAGCVRSDRRVSCAFGPGIAPTGLSASFSYHHAPAASPCLGVAQVPLRSTVQRIFYGSGDLLRRQAWIARRKSTVATHTDRSLVPRELRPRRILLRHGRTRSSDN